MTYLCAVTPSDLLPISQPVSPAASESGSRMSPRPAKSSPKCRWSQKSVRSEYRRRSKKDEVDEAIFGNSKSNENASNKKASNKSNFTVNIRFKPRHLPKLALPVLCSTSYFTAQFNLMGWISVKRIIFRTSKMSHAFSK